MDNWEELTSDHKVLEYITGYKIEFESNPIQDCTPRPYPQTTTNSVILSNQIDDLLHKGVIYEIPIYDASYVSNVFLRPKPNGKHRMIIDLSGLNEFVEKIHFKMDHLDVALDMVYKGCWFTSVDLQDAYYSVPIWGPHQSYLSFLWEQKMYSFSVLPFGLTSAPRVFTKLLKPVFASLREKGISCLSYIDDCLVVSSTKNYAESDSQQLLLTLVDLGFKINETKSSLIPRTEITFLGYVIDSLSMTVRPTWDKICKTKEKILSVLQRKSFVIREIAELIGILVDLCKGVEYGSRHYRELEKDKIFSLRRAGQKEYNGTMVLTHKAREDLQWWLTNLGHRRKQIRTKAPEVVITTDASEEGWGAISGKNKTGGRWSTSKAGDHINVLELRAVLLGLQSFHSENRDLQILVETDSSTTVSYVNKMGGTKSASCNKIACEIWDFCEERDLWLMATHIPGDDNIEADFESRHFSDDTEWELHDTNFQRICETWGEPSVDLFASRLNHKTPSYVSWRYDPGAFAINAFSISWSKFDLSYIFPPFRLVGRCVRKAKAEGAKTIIVAPRWPGQTWYTYLLREAVGPPLLFRGGRENLVPAAQHLEDSPIREIPLIAVLC